jgi:hypothetical protein
VKPSSYVPLFATLAGSVFFSALAAAIGAGLLGVSFLVPGLIALDLVAISACYWYLNGRLVCLGNRFTCTGQNGNPVPLPDNQECAIGVIGSPGHSGLFRPRISGLNPSKWGDDDSTMDILLAPGPTTLDDPNLNDYWNQVQGYLITDNADIGNIGLGYVQSGDDLDYVKFLHCEFEGSGIQDFLDWLLEILAFLLAILAVQAFVPGGTAIIALLAILAALLTLLAGVNLFTGVLNPTASGDPTDVSPSLGNLQAGDIVMVSGNWIYDSGHAGWNEIHAVHNCQKIAEIVSVNNPDGTQTWSWPSDIGGGLGLATPGQVTAARSQFCCAVGSATGAVKGGSTTDPANNWVIHPLIDGCKKPPVIY